MMSFSYDEALRKSIEYFDGDELAARVFIDKYSLRTDKDEILEDTPEKMHWRIANELAKIESKKFKIPLSSQEIFNYLDRFKKIILQGSPMFGIGNPYHCVTLSNCYVLETPLDSYGGICKTDEQLVQISKRRGGCGIDISKIRPSGSVVNNSSRTATGIVPFMRRFSNSIREVGQGGRRGALMITISVHHPQILDFASIKKDKNEVTGANISIRLTDEFLNAVDKDLEYEQRWPVDSKNPKISIKVKAKDVWKEIIKNAHNMAEPGLLFWDTIIKESPADCYSEQGFSTQSTNPCVAPETLILTKDGNKIISTLENQEVEVWNGKQWSKTTIVKTSENQKLIRVILENGQYIDCTEYHKFYVDKNDWIIGYNGKSSTIVETIAKDLQAGQIVHRVNKNSYGGYYQSLEKIESIIDINRFDKTYCCNEPLEHKAVFNGILTGQCSELPLSILDSCRLAVINLLSYVKEPFTEKSKFDYDEFFKDSKILQRIMDDLVDLELEHIDKIITKIKNDAEPKEIKERELELWDKIKYACFNGRRTGSGITGLGDALAALGVKYCSEESIKIVSKIYKTLKLGCYWSSVEMSKELGAFPIWKHELEKDNPFLLRIKDEDEVLWREMKKYGRRNIAILTTAPTGSVSILTQTSSGVEPVFQTHYIRRKKITHEDKNSRIDFIDNVGDKWQEFPVYHNTIKKWMEITKETDIKKSPWYGCCAEDLNWPDRVKLQAAAQLHIDHAISSTLNLPENVSVNKVAEIYETAWKSGCKGITIYRKNCRTGVLVDSDKKKNESIKYNDAPKRPKLVDGHLHFFTVKGEKYYVAIGLINNKEPYEIFTGFNTEKKHEFIPKEAKNGVIIKNGRGNYSFREKITQEEYRLNDGHSDESAEALTRALSCGLRHGAKLSFLIHQLEKTKGELQSFSKCLARTLKCYLEDGEKISGENCSNCNSPNLERSNGCSVCKDCGNSKCQ